MKNNLKGQYTQNAKYFTFMFFKHPVDLQKDLITVVFI